MFKRLFWLTVGAAAGFSGSVWLQRRVRRATDRFLPSAVQADVKAALQEGRDAMREKEAELRARIGPGRASTGR